jgi:hypothetical protein
MARRYANIDKQLLLRAARLARLPGVRRAEACERFELSIGMLRRAIREFGAQARPGARDIVLHALTDAGTRRADDRLPNLATVASYVDFVDKDGCTAARVEEILAELVRDGVLAIDGTAWRLLKDFP